MASELRHHGTIARGAALSDLAPSTGKWWRRLWLRETAATAGVSDAEDMGGDSLVDVDEEATRRGGFRGGARCYGGELARAQRLGKGAMKKGSGMVSSGVTST
jgi:hypothetical protein